MTLVEAKDFLFKTDPSSMDYLNEIVGIMIQKFNISREECVGRINQEWNHIDTLVGFELFYHELPEVWANDFYFGHDSFWWFQGDERVKRKLPLLQPLPYPKN